MKSKSFTSDEGEIYTITKSYIQCNFNSDDDPRRTSTETFHTIYDKLISRKDTNIPTHLTKARWPVTADRKRHYILIVGCKRFTSNDFKQIKKLLKEL